MKRLPLIPVLILMLLLLSTPVFAADPPSTEVDVTVVTPGDVDLDVDIYAGGDVDVTIDGVDFKQTAATANDAYSTANDAYRKAFAPTNHLWDYSYYWSRSGIGNMVEGRLAELEGVANLMISAQAKLIQGYELTSEEVSNINIGLDRVRASSADSVKTIEATLNDLKAQDEKTWNQLMYGAEAHIAILEGLSSIQSQDILALQAEVGTLTIEGDSLVGQLDKVRADHLYLRSYTNYLQLQYLYYFWILGGIVAVLAVGLIVALRRKWYE